MSIRPERDASGRITHHTVQLAGGRTLQARRVLLGIGSTNMKRLPPFAADLIAPPSTDVTASSFTAVGGGASEGDHADGKAALGGMSNAVCSEAARGAGSLPPAGVVMHSWDIVAAVSASADAGEAPAATSAASYSISISTSSSPAACAICCTGHSSCPAAGSGVPRKLQPPHCPMVDAPAALVSTGLVRPGDRIAIVGGGLTSAHLTQLAVAAGAAHVTLVLRGPLRVKQVRLR
jgi:hypothetical protein